MVRKLRYRQLIQERVKRERRETEKRFEGQTFRDERQKRRLIYALSPKYRQTVDLFQFMQLERWKGRHGAHQANFTIEQMRHIHKVTYKTLAEDFFWQRITFADGFTDNTVVLKKENGFDRWISPKSNLYKRILRYKKRREAQRVNAVGTPMEVIEEILEGKQ